MGDNIYSLGRILLENGAARQYLLERGVFYETMSCPNCQGQMVKCEERWAFYCWSRGCRLQKSISDHTFFSGTRLGFNQVLIMAKLWIDEVPIKSAVSFTGISKPTICRFWAHFRQLVASTLEIEDTVIGGKDIIVEVDETKLGKRKYNRGHRVEGVWVVVGVERTEARKVFIVPVDKRNTETLQDVVRRHVSPGSKIHTDLWRGYSWIDRDEDYLHGTVNHSVSFKDSETGVHTNTVEGTNSGLKRKIPIRSRVKNGINGHLDEFVWRRKHSGPNIWDSFISAIKDVHYDLE